MRGNVNQVGQGATISDWYASVPIITKVLVTSTVLLAAALQFSLVSPHALLLDWTLVINRFQIWRLLSSCVFAGGFSFNFLMHTVALYQTCMRYEAFPYNTGAGGNAADFLLLILVGVLLLTIAGHFFGLPVVSVPLLYMIMYVWSRHEPDAPVSFYGFKFQGLYLPWIYIGINTLMGNSITAPLVGVGAGHVYFFLVDIMPQTYGYTMLKTPRFCVDIISYVTGATIAPIAAAPRGQNEQARPAAGFGNMGAGHNWGRGNTLGTR